MTSSGSLVLRTLVVEEVRDLQFYATCVGGAVLAAFHIGGANHPAVALTVEEVIDIKVAGEHSLEKTLVDPSLAYMHPTAQAEQAQGSPARRVLAFEEQSLQDCFQKAIALNINYLGSPIGIYQTRVEVA